MSTARDLLLATRAKRAGARSSLRIIWEARRANLPISWAFALCDQETGFRNVFGHDRGSILAGQPVTKAGVKTLLAHIADGGTSNGVGFTQLTYPPFIRQAEHLGGAHRVKNQLRVGFQVFAQHIDHGRATDAAWHYNGDPSYQGLIAAKQKHWHQILDPKKG